MQIAVAGAAEATDAEYQAAYASRGPDRTGRVCPCLRGPRRRDGGGLQRRPGAWRDDRGDPLGDREGNPYLGIVIRSGLGHARNILVAQSGDAMIAIGGSHGTLSEIAIALKTGCPVFGIGSWDIDGVVKCTTPGEAVEMAVRAAVTSPKHRRREPAGMLNRPGQPTEYQ